VSRGTRQSALAYGPRVLSIVGFALLVILDGNPRSAVAAAECTVAPLTVPQLTDLAVASPFADYTPVATLKDETPASDNVIAEVTAVIEESIACVNANDIPRALALFTPGYLQRRYGGANGDDLGHLLAALTRTPAPASPEDQLTLVEIARVVILLDGSVVAEVTTANLSEKFVDVLRFVQVDGKWRIDDVSPGEPEALATPAT
jgi:hypothetical protein